MSGLSLKHILIIELVLAFVIGLFSLDFLPRNKAEYERICTERWSKDPKQYEICMEPHSKQVELDKYAIGAGVIAAIAFPVGYFLTRKKS